MDFYFKRCLEKKNLVKVEIDKALIEKELAASESDLNDSKDVFRISKYKLAAGNMPWRLETYIVFHSSLLAKQFERYLKSGSGKTFLKRRLMAL